MSCTKRFGFYEIVLGSENLCTIEKISSNIQKHGIFISIVSAFHFSLFLFTMIFVLTKNSEKDSDIYTTRNILDSRCVL